MGKKIIGIDGLTARDIDFEVQGGAKFVTYMYCVSILVLSFKRYSDIYFVKPGDKTLKHSLPFTLIALVFGWWGIPWGPIWTIMAIGTNVSGGKDVTNEVRVQLK